MTGGSAGPAPGSAGALDSCELRTAAEGLASLRERRLAWQASASSALFFEQAFEKKAASEMKAKGVVELEALPMSGALARILDAAKMKEQKAGEYSRSLRLRRFHILRKLESILSPYRIALTWPRFLRILFPSML